MAGVSERMSWQKSRDTTAERALRSELHRRGFRYRVHRQPIPKLRREADLLNRRLRVAIFVDGCFWHGCPLHATWPKTNAEFWRNKIETNRRRDLHTGEQLSAAGWTVLRVWEHEDSGEAANRIMSVIHQLEASD